MEADGALAGVGAEEENNLVETFCGITSSSPEEARFFLESHNWQIDAAVHSFFDNADDDNSAAAAAAAVATSLPSHRSPPSSAAPERRRRRRRHPRPESEEDEDEDEDYVPSGDDEASQLARASDRVTAPAMGSRDKKSSRPSGSSRPAGGIRTLADLNRGSGIDSDSDDSDGPQEYYTGGEKSGMLVQDPSKGKHDVDAIFEQARQMGATQGPVEHLRPSSSSRSFIGTGRLLSGETVQAAAQPPENVVHDVVFWTNGFTIDDGPLRRFDDPENAAFLESIKKSECPKELEPADRRTSVQVNLTRREEKFQEPVVRSSPFQGVGRTLASPYTSPALPEPAATNILTAPSPSAGLSVDSSLPSTSIQLRLADGTRMVARFNNYHTIGDIRAFIDASRPGATRSYHLQTVGFPPKQLTDVTQTIEQAGLANSVVIQRL